MGVIHKLRDEVVDFILAQKKAEPEISCRKLSDIVSKKFSTVVSKSSISTVLKNANLNSPVGRHGLGENEPVQKAVPKFKIPFSLSEGGLKQKKIQNPKPEIKPISKPIVKEKKPALEMSSLKSPGVSVPDSRIKNIENAGALLLKAAEWDLAGGSIFGRIIKDELSGRFDVNYEALSDLLLFPELNYIDIDEKRAVLDPQVYPALTAAVNDISDCAVKLLIELEILFRSVALAKVTDGQGAEAFLDLRHRVIEFSSVQSENRVSVPEAVRTINSGAFNVQSAVFHYISNVNNISNIAKLLSVITTKSGLKEISLRDENGVELVKDRYFQKVSPLWVLAVWTWKKHMSSLEAALKVKTEFTAFAFLNKTFYIAEVAWPGLYSGRALAVSLRPFPTGEAFVVLLTNSMDNNKALLEFLYAWPGLGDDFVAGVAHAEAFEALKPPAIDVTGIETFTQSMGFLKSFLNRWVQERFFGLATPSFDEKTLKDLFFQLPGNIVDHDSRLTIIELHVPASHPHADLIKKAVGYFNSRMFCDSKGSRLHLQAVRINNI